MTEPRDSRDDEEARRERATDEDRATRVHRGRSTLHHGDTADALRPDEPDPVPPEDPRAAREPRDEADPTEGRPT
ncbi:hypothetical protein [Pseudonocardia lacus]|uniref:hypothetical protein n=1 Tax=Pseudonocardia lacus TaxID=2835865 RepID=UPI001BDD7BF8|nr:hypothetical protein [Pseudonocardia lacus]